MILGCKLQVNMELLFFSYSIPETQLANEAEKLHQRAKLRLVAGKISVGVMVTAIRGISARGCGGHKQRS